MAGSRIAVPIRFLFSACLVWFALFGLVSVELPLLLFSTQGLPWITGAEVSSLLGLRVGAHLAQNPKRDVTCRKDPYLHAYTLALEFLL